MIQNILKNAFKKKILIDIVMNENEDEESIIGYIVEVDKDYFTINEVDKNGHSNGNTIYNISEIKTISTNNWYLKNLKILIENNNSFNKNLRTTIWKKGKCIIPHFSSIKESQIITMFFFENDDFEIGILLDYYNDYFTLKNIGQDGREYGITTYRMENIIGLQYNGLGEQKTKILYDKKYSQR
jgi:hypothetical protein